MYLMLIDKNVQWAVSYSAFILLICVHCGSSVRTQRYGYVSFLTELKPPWSTLQ